MPQAVIKVARPRKEIGGVDWSTVNPAQYPVQSLNLSWSWGSEPSEANIVYLSDNEIKVGSAIQLTVGPYFFSGICKRDAPLVSSKGRTRQLTFQDYRKWLAMDKVYASFNVLDDRLINGQRVKRYRHILPWNHFSRRCTWTSGPYTAAQILYYCITGPGIETPWTMAYTNASGNIFGGFHASLGYPVYDVDFEKGKSLAQVMVDMAEATGLLFTLMPDEADLFRLVWSMKGVDGPDLADLTLEDPLALTEPFSDDRETAQELSDNPTRVRVLGDRNLYQVHDIDLVPDWNTNWSQFYTVDLLTDYIYRNTAAFNSIVGDTEHQKGWQLAKSRATEITVWEFQEDYFGVGNTYLDNRKYRGKCRNDMPAALYINDLLFRCFRLPDNFYFYNTYGDPVYTDSIDAVEKLLAAVYHDPVAGTTSYSDPAVENADGNAYVIVQGYQVGKDMFETVRPDRFNINEWLTSQNLWQKIDASVVNNGDAQGPSIIFHEPVIVSSNLVEYVDNLAVISAQATFTVPAVRATLTFAAENFSWYQTLVTTPDSPPADAVTGTQIHDEVLNIQLNGEFIRLNGAINEVLYGDGRTVRYKAIEFANSFLRRQQIHASGSFTKQFNDGDDAYRLHGKLDRITLDHSPAGSNVKVYLTNERGREIYQPERDLDRMTRLRALLPGEAELRKSSRYALKLASAMGSSRDAQKTLANAFKGGFPHAPPEKNDIKPGASQPGTDTIAVGSVFLKKPTEQRAVVGNRADADHVIFAGISVRNGEQVDASHGASFGLQRNGVALARVKIPATRGDSVLTNTDQNYLSTDGNGSVVGSVVQDVTGTTGAIKLAYVNLGVSGVASYPFKIEKVSSLVYRVAYGSVITTGDPIAVSGISPATHTLAADEWCWFVLDLTSTTAAISHVDSFATTPTWSQTKIPIGYVDTIGATDDPAIEPTINQFIHDNVFAPCV